MGLNSDEKKTEISPDNATENKFLKSVRKVVKMLDIDERNIYSKVFSENIRRMAAEIEINLDFFLENKKINFRTEEFLLVLFQELYEEFLYLK
ncbi:MAG: hypothetical protein ACTSWY_05260 [Promethearchaeota archaeon]